nr:MAG TPA: BppU domain protein [Caudoviricetes sp.]
MITVVGRKLIIPETDKQIGTTYDNNSEVRHIRINRITTGGVDLSNLRFKLDLEYADTTPDTCLLDVEVQDEYILLTWTIPDSCVAHKGTVWAAIRAYDENGTVKWATNRGPLYVDHTIFDGEAYSGHLAEFEQLEERITQKIEILDTNESERQTAEEQREANEERRINNEAEWQRQAEAAIDAANATLEIATEKAATATRAADTATTKASEASSSATLAGQSAATATQKAETATTKAAEASDSAASASQSATTATQKAETATTKAGEADASATSAGQSATIATQKAEVATTKAAEAAASAERAQQAAGCDGTAQSISAIDTQGLLTEIGGNSNAQALLDELALRVATQLVSNTAFTAELLKYVAKSQIVNNLLATETGNVLDAVQGKALADMIGNTADLPGGAADIVSAIVTQNSNFDKYYSLSDAIQIPSGADLNNYTDFGNYVSSAASISSTLQNCPALNGGFVLHVERVTGATDGTFLKQRIIYNEAKSLEFWRVKTGKESWSSWVSPITNADYNAQSITNQYGLNLHLVKFGNDNLKVIRLSGYINKTLTAGTEYIIASNVSLKSRVDWYHNVFVSGKGSELTVYLNIDNDGNVKITPKTAIASGTAINMMEYYV